MVPQLNVESANATATASGMIAASAAPVVGSPTTASPDREDAPPSTPSRGSTGSGASVGTPMKVSGGVKKGKGGRKAANPTMSDEERRQERVLKNRVSAMRSLQKKKRYTDDLEKRAKLLTAQNLDLKTRIYGLVNKLAQNGVPVAHFMAPYPLDAVLQNLLSQHNPYALHAATAAHHPHALLQQQQQQQHLLTEHHRAALVAAAQRQAVHSGQVVQGQRQSQKVPSQPQHPFTANHTPSPPPPPSPDASARSSGDSPAIVKQEDCLLAQPVPLPREDSAVKLVPTDNNMPLDVLDDIGDSFLSAVDPSELALLDDVNFNSAPPDSSHSI